MVDKEKFQAAWNKSSSQRTEEEKVLVHKGALALAYDERKHAADNTTPAMIQDLVHKAACATGSQAAYLAKAFKPAKNKVIYCAELDLWQTLHDSLAEIPVLAKYARRMEQYGNALLGYAASWDIDGNPIPHEDLADNILIWTKKAGKFSLARHAKEELAYLRKHTHKTSLVNFHIGKMDKTGIEARREALAVKAASIGKTIKALAKQVEKLDNGEILNRLVTDFMFAIATLPPSLRTPYTSHMVHAHEAAVGADLANLMAAKIADAPATDKAEDKPSKGKGKGKGK